MQTTARFPLLNLLDTWLLEVAEIDTRCPQEWAVLHTELAATQYAYIKFGLLLERIKTKCGYKYSGSHLSSFKDFCTHKIHLTVWQANTYIQAAKVAIYLARAGFEILPKNYSQAVTLVKVYDREVGYYDDRPALDIAWKNILATNNPTEITTHKINAEIDPDWQEKQSLKLPKTLLERARKIATARGITVREYLTELMDGDEESTEIDSPTTLEFTDADARIMDDLDRQFSLEPPHPDREYPPINEVIIDNLFDRILRSICDIYRQRSQVTQLELLTAKEANEDSGGGG